MAHFYLELGGNEFAMQLVHMALWYLSNQVINQEAQEMN